MKKLERLRLGPGAVMNDGDVSLNRGGMSGIVVAESFFPIDGRVAVSADRGCRFRRRLSSRRRLFLGENVARAVDVQLLCLGIEVDLPAEQIVLVQQISVGVLGVGLDAGHRWF